MSEQYIDLVTLDSLVSELLLCASNFPVIYSCAYSAIES